MSFETRSRWSLCAALLLCAASCDKGSVGEFGETEGEAGGESDGATTSASGDGATTSASGSASAGPGTAGSMGATTTEGSTGGSSGPGVSLDISNAGFCENPQHGCEGPAECGESCGALDSMFDEDGCVRVACNEGEGCGDGEFCYRPDNYGGCQSSDLSCSEFDGVCGCGSLPDCGGAYCVPEAIVFGGIVEGPTTGLVTTECGPDDGSAFSIAVGSYASNACGGQFDAGPLLTIFVAQEFGTLGMTATEGDVYVHAQYSTDGTPETTQIAQWVVLRISEWEATLTGDYEVLLEDETLLVGTFTSVVSCPSDVICG